MFILCCLRRKKRDWDTAVRGCKAVDGTGRGHLFEMVYFFIPDRVGFFCTRIVGIIFPSITADEEWRLSWWDPEFENS